MKLNLLAMTVFLVGTSGIAKAQSNGGAPPPITWDSARVMTSAEVQAAKDRLTEELNATGFDGNRATDEFKKSLETTDASVAYRCDIKNQPVFSNGIGYIAYLILSADQKKLTYRSDSLSLPYTARVRQEDGSFVGNYKMAIDCGIDCEYAEDRIVFSPQTLNLNVTTRMGNFIKRHIYSPMQYEMSCRAIAISDLKNIVDHANSLSEQLTIIQATMDSGEYYGR